MKLNEIIHIKLLTTIMLLSEVDVIRGGILCDVKKTLFPLSRIL